MNPTTSPVSCQRAAQRASDGLASQMDQPTTPHDRMMQDGGWEMLTPDLTGVGRFVWDIADNSCLMDDRLREMTGLKDMPAVFSATEFFDNIHIEDRHEVEVAAEKAIVQGELFQAEFRFVRPDGGRVWLTGRGRMLTDSDGRRFMMGVNSDISEQKAVEMRHELVAAEMAHRVKNLLSLVSGIFRITMRSSDNMEDLSTAFLGRIQALSSINHIVLRSADRSAPVRAIVDETLAAHIGLGRLTLEVPDFILNGPAAQTTCLALNELVTNAIKYGALSDEDGQIALTMTVDAEADSYVMEWVETLTRTIMPPPKTTGFGLQVLMRMTRSTFKGEPEIEWRPNGFRFVCRSKASDMAPQAGI